MLNLLVTGASGLIGGEVCRRLVERGHRVIALTHRATAIRGNDGRVVEPVETVSGDIGEADLGLSGAVPAGIDCVVHCAASVRFQAPAAEHRAINCEGTRNVAAFARTAGASMLHVSTAYVCGRRDGPVAEVPVPTDGRFANGYEASKAEAEAIVAASGVPHAIARPSIVLGDRASGAIREFGAIYAAFRLIAEGRVTHMPASPDATLDFVPIDHVAGGIVAIAERMEEAKGKIFHLTSERPLPVENFAAAIASYPQFAKLQFVDADRFDPDGLSPAERRRYLRMVAPFAAYFQQSPRFDDANLRALASHSGPPADLAWMRRLIDFAIARGYLPNAD